MSCTLRYVSERDVGVFTAIVNAIHLDSGGSKSSSGAPRLGSEKKVVSAENFFCPDFGKGSFPSPPFCPSSERYFGVSTPVT